MIYTTIPTSCDLEAHIARGRKAANRLTELRNRIPVVLPPDIESVTHERSGIVTSMKSRAYRTRVFQWLRVTEIHSPAGTWIFNLGGFPWPECNMPLVEAEVVILRGRLHLLLLDAIAMTGTVWTSMQDPPATLLGRLTEEARDTLPQTVDRPEWASAVRGPHAFWSAPRSEEAVGPAMDVLKTFLDWVAETDLDISRQTADRIHAGERFERLDAVCETCVREAPSRPFLSRFFGEKWAERYIDEFLYPRELRA